jgi:hypothetical protein
VIPPEGGLVLDLLPYLSTVMDEASVVYRAALDEAERFDLNRDGRPARAHAWATAVLRYYGYGYPGRPDIISGYRSPSKQRALLQRWNAGDRVGLTAKPACQSWHMLGRAIDVQTDVRGFRHYAYLLHEYTGARDGRAFGDPGHFDWPIDKTPPNICQHVA